MLYNDSKLDLEYIPMFFLNAMTKSRGISIPVTLLHSGDLPHFWSCGAQVQCPSHV